MKYAICVAMALVWSCTTHAQPTFQKLYRSGTSYSFNLLELPGHNIFTPIGATLLLNPQGFVEHASGYYGGDTYRVQTLKAVAANRFTYTTSMYVGSCPWGSAGLFHPVLGIMDSLGQTLAMRKYELNSGICYGPPAGLEITNDQGSITWGRDRNFYAMRVDSDLEHVWSKRVMHQGGFQFIKELPGGDLVAGINMDTAGVVVARLDPDGNFLWTKSYLRPGGMVHDVLVESDDSFIITGYTDTTNLLFTQTLPASFQPKLFIMKLNGEGEVLWCKGWFSSPFLWYSGRPSRIVGTLDGNYAILATLGQPQNNFQYHPFLLKTDTNGDTLWTRSVGRNEYRYITQDLLAYSDGGFMMSGIIYGDLPYDSSLDFIYKTDSLGRFDCQERSNPVQVLDLFPVDSSFTLSVMDGLATVTPLFVNDTLLDPSIFTVYNGCTFTTNLPPTRSGSRSMSVRPNPNTGHFTVVFQDPLMAESYYSVFDAMGKLLYQRPLPQGKETEEVDLSRFGPGTYVIRFTDREGSCYERVVVE